MLGAVFWLVFIDDVTADGSRRINSNSILLYAFVSRQSETTAHVSLGCLLVSTIFGGSSPNTGSSGDSGACAGPGGTGLGPPDTKLPLLLPPTSRTSQWSEVDELVEPAGERNRVEMCHRQLWT